MKIDPGFAEELLAGALRSGADEAEVFMKSYKNLSVDIKGQAVDSLTSSLSYGYSLRVIKDNRPGFSYATDVAEKDSVITLAVESAKHSDRDDFLGLPGPSGHAEVDVYDPAVSQISEDDAIGLTMLLERSAFETDTRIKKLRKASGSFTTSETVIVNSKSLKARYLSTACTAQIMAIAEEGEESRTGWDFSGSRHLRDVSFESVGRTAAERAVRLLGARTIAGARIGVILENSVTVDFLGIFAASLSSEALQKGKSLLKDRLGQRVISPGVNIVDSGLRPGKLGSRPADDEGVPVREKTVVQEGVLQTFLYNTYTAKKGNTESTGNAVRGGGHLIAFRGHHKSFHRARASQRMYGIERPLQVP